MRTKIKPIHGSGSEELGPSLEPSGKTAPSLVRICGSFSAREDVEVVMTADRGIVKRMVFAGMSTFATMEIMSNGIVNHRAHLLHM